MWQWTDKEGFHWTTWENRIITCFTCLPTLLLPGTECWSDTLILKWSFPFLLQEKLRSTSQPSGTVRSRCARNTPSLGPRSRECSLLAADNTKRCPGCSALAVWIHNFTPGDKCTNQVNSKHLFKPEMQTKQINTLQQLRQGRQLWNKAKEKPEVVYISTSNLMGQF